jgi:hypothetical protein
MAMTPQQLGYAAAQQKRLDAAYKSNDNSLVNRLINDSKAKGYSLKTMAATPAKPYGGLTLGIDKQQPMPGKVQTPIVPEYKTSGLVIGADTVTPQAPKKMVTKDNVPKVITNDVKNEVTPEMNTKTTPTNPVYQFIDSSTLQKTPFNYDFTKDPLYLTALQNALNTAGTQSKKAQQNAMEALNERGILNSSITQSQLAQIAGEYDQQARDSVLNNLVPQLMQQAYGRYQDQYNQKRNDYLDALNEAQAFGYVTPRLSQITGYKVNTPLFNTKQLTSNQAMDNKQFQEDVRHNKVLESNSATNAQANMTRATTSATKTGKGFSPTQQLSFVDKTIKPLLDQQIGQDSFGFDMKTGKYVLKDSAIPQFNDVMNSIRGNVDDAIIRSAYLRYNVPLPVYLLTPNDENIISFSSNQSESKINPEWIK